MSAEALQSVFWAGVGFLAALGFLGILYWSRRAGRRRQALDETRAYLLGVRYLLSDNPDAAIEELTRVVRVNTETVETYFALGELFRRKGELERAIRIHQNILLRPALPAASRDEARYQLALDYRKAGMLAQAREALSQVVDAERTLGRARIIEALTHLRDVHLEAGEVPEAVTAQRRLHRLSGNGDGAVLAHLLAELARRHVAEARPDEARAALKEALKVDPESVDAHLAAGDLAVRQGQGSTAIDHYDAALARRPEAVLLAYGSLSELFWNRERYDELGEYLRGWVRQRPDAPQLRLALARFLRKRGLTDMAVTELRTALELDPRYGDARQELGRILLEDDMGAELRREYEALLDAMGADAAFRCEVCGHGLPELLWRCPRCASWDRISATVAPARSADPSSTRPVPATSA